MALSESDKRQRVTLFEETEGQPFMVAEVVGEWNGFAVPRVAAETLVAYWRECAANDPNGEWHALPFVDDEGNLRLPSANDPDDREEDFVYRPDVDGLYAIDGLVWSIAVDEETGR